MGTADDIVQKPHLPAGSRPELHDFARPDPSHHLRGDVPDDNLLDPREIVLRKLSDALEENGTGVVVEIFGGEPTRASLEPPPDIIREHREERRLVGMDVEAESRGVVGRGSLVVSRHAGAPSERHGPETGEDVAAVALVESAPGTADQAPKGGPPYPPHNPPLPPPKHPGLP